MASLKLLVKAIIQVIYILAYPLLFVIFKTLQYFSTRLEIKKHVLEIPNLDKNLEGLKIIHLSDFHFDYMPNTSKFSLYKRLPRKFLQRVIDETNALSPDLILLTGDYVQREIEPLEELAKDYFSQLRCKTIIATLGNHDIKVDKHKVIEILHKHCHVQVLEQAPGCHAVVMLEKKTNGEGMEVHKVDVVAEEGTNLVSSSKACIEIVGFPDYHDVSFHDQFNRIIKFYGHSAQGGSKEEIPKHRGSLLRIIMSHNPSTERLFQQYNWDYDLLLLGHTHAGQICLPVPRLLYKTHETERLESDKNAWFIRVPLIPIIKETFFAMPAFIREPLRKLSIVRRVLNVVRNWRLGIGLHQQPERSEGAKYVHTHTGLGSHMNLRILCNPELVQLTLTSSSSK